MVFKAVLTRSSCGENEDSDGSFDGFDWDGGDGGGIGEAGVAIGL